MPIAPMFEIERDGETIIFTPPINLSESQDVTLNAKGAIDALCDLSIKYVVMDFHKTDYFGSSALALFIRFWKIVADRNGHMAFCNLSEQEREVMQITRLDTLWPICESRAAAMKAVGNSNFISKATTA